MAFFLGLLYYVVEADESLGECVDESLSKNEFFTDLLR